MQNSEILEALEALGAYFPWDTVAIWIERQPAGEIRFTAYLPGEYGTGRQSAFGHGKTLAEACADLKKSAGIRDPEGMRAAKLEELRQQIAKLEAVTFCLPPYKPGTLLAPGAFNSVIEV